MMQGLQYLLVLVAAGDGDIIPWCKLSPEPRLQAIYKIRKAKSFPNVNVSLSSRHFTYLLTHVMILMPYPDVNSVSQLNDFTVYI